MLSWRIMVRSASHLLPVMFSSYLDFVMAPEKSQVVIPFHHILDEVSNQFKPFFPNICVFVCSQI